MVALYPRLHLCRSRYDLGRHNLPCNGIALGQDPNRHHTFDLRDHALYFQGLNFHSSDIDNLRLAPQKLYPIVANAHQVSRGKPLALLLLIGPRIAQHRVRRAHVQLSLDNPQLHISFAAIEQLYREPYFAVRAPRSKSPSRWRHRFAIQAHRENKLLICAEHLRLLLLRQR